MKSVLWLAILLIFLSLGFLFFVGTGRGFNNLGCSSGLVLTMQIISAVVWILIGVVVALILTATNSVQEAKKHNPGFDL